MHIKDSLILITGASSGIGAATARAAARAGARVVLVARTQAALEAVAGEIRAAGGQAWVYAADLSDPVQVARMAVSVAREAGLPDIIVNSAGAGRWLFIEETSAEEAQEMMAAPYFTTFYTTRAFLPAMLARGSGQIVIINSPASRAAWPGATGYTAARWALKGFTEALRADLRGTGLSVTSVVPAKVLSPYFDHNPGTLERGPRLARLIPDLTTEQAAEGVLWAAAHNRREHVMPAMLRVFYGLHWLAPRLMEGVLVRTGWQRSEQQAPQGPVKA
jgi:short-subunit dehydrogenase